MPLLNHFKISKSIAPTVPCHGVTNKKNVGTKQYGYSSPGYMSWMEENQQFFWQRLVCPVLSCLLDTS